MLVACDGSSFKNGEANTPIGWAWAREDGAWCSNGMVGGTNNRAELHAIISVLLFHPKGELTVQMDSQYAMNIAQSWALSWYKRGWKKADNKPIQNLDLVKELVKLRMKREDPVKFQWVKAHVTNSTTPLNVEADKRAYEAMARVRSAVEAELQPESFYLDSKGRVTMPQEVRLLQRLYG